MSPGQAGAAEERPRLRAAERAALQRLIDDPTTSRRRATRARIALAADRGAGDREIAAAAGVSIPTAALWRKRYATLGLAGLDDLPRSGRPRTFGASRARRRGSGGAETIVQNGPAADEHGLDHLLEAAARTIARRGF